jgi:hypothetical protein
LGVGHTASNLVPEKIKTAKNAQLLKDGQMNNRRPKRVLRNKKDNIYLGTWKPYATRPKGRPRVRWEDDVKNDLRKTGVSNWKQRTQERRQWKGIVEQAKTHKEL